MMQTFGKMFAEDFVSICLILNIWFKDVCDDLRLLLFNTKEDDDDAGGVRVVPVQQNFHPAGIV